MLWTILIIIALLLLGTLLGCGLVFYVQFKRSPAKLWSDRVFMAVDAVARQQDQEHQRLHEAEQQHKQAVDALQHRAFQSFLATISIHELDDAPGIGPATVATLGKAGFRNLANLQQAVIAIPGVGEKRLADIDAAVTNLTNKAQQSFDAGHCPQAVALPRQVQELERQRHSIHACTQARLRAAGEIGRQLELRVVEAKRVTFWNYLRHRFKDQASIGDINTSLPDLAQALEAAEAEARRLNPIPPPAATPAPPPVAKRSDRISRRRPEPQESPTGKKVPPASVAVQPAMAPVPVAALAPLQDRSLEMLELTVQLLLAVARTDGRIAERERRLVEDHLRRRYQYNPALYNRAKVLCAHFEAAAIDMDRCLQGITELFTVPHRTALVQVACEVAATSGGVKQRENGLLSKICTRLGIAMPAGPTPPPEPPTAQEPLDEINWLATLEIEGGVNWTPELVRRQYHLLTARYEPAKVHGMGPEFAAMAEQKHLAVRAAAEGLLGKLGLELEEEKPPPPADLRHNPDLDALFGG